MKKIYRMGRTKKKLLEFIKDLIRQGKIKTVSPQDLLDNGWKGSPTYLRTLLLRMVDEDYFRMLGPAEYELTEKGEEIGVGESDNEYITLIDAVISRKRANAKKSAEKIKDLEKELKKAEEEASKIDDEILRLNSLKIKLEKNPDLIASVIRESQLLFKNNTENS